MNSDLSFVRFIKARKCIVLLCALSVLILQGCTPGNLVITTGFDKTELMRINDTSTYLPEYMLYLTTVQNQYEKIYGEGLWTQEYGNESLEDRVKNKVIAELGQVKVMNLMARDYGIDFSEAEVSDIEKKATVFYDSLTETEIESLKLTYDICLNACKEYVMSGKVYDFVIKDVNPEISDDEARTVTVLQIFVKTYSADSNDAHIAYSERAAREAYEKINLAGSLLEDKDTSFESIQAKYNESPDSVLTISRGMLEPEIEEPIFNLSRDEISPVIKTDDGYYIFKCISDFDIDSTQKNKINILNEQREQVFEETYNKYLTSITKSLNKELFDSIKMLHDPEIVTSNFFELMD